MTAEPNTPPKQTSSYALATEVVNVSWDVNISADSAENESEDESQQIGTRLTLWHRAKTAW